VVPFFSFPAFPFQGRKEEEVYDLGNGTLPPNGYHREVFITPPPLSSFFLSPLYVLNCEMIFCPLLFSPQATRATLCNLLPFVFVRDALTFFSFFPFFPPFELTATSRLFSLLSPSPVLTFKLQLDFLLLPLFPFPFFPSLLPWLEAFPPARTRFY